MSHVAIVTDTASDIDPRRAEALGIDLVPLIVSFGTQSYRAGVEMSAGEFWERMTAPDAPFPTTAAASPGAFKEAYEACFARGADAVVVITVGSKLSGTHKSATIARELLADREIHVIDSRNASMGQGLLAMLAADLAAAGGSGTEIAATVEARAADAEVVVVLETLEYLRRGGRISGPQAAIGTLLSVKPLISIKDGTVDTVDRVRTRSKARERAIEYLTPRPIERLAILHTVSPDVEAFRDDLIARAGAIHPDAVTVNLVGPSIGPHLGPGAVGAAILRRPLA